MNGLIAWAHYKASPNRPFILSIRMYVIDAAAVSCRRLRRRRRPRWYLRVCTPSSHAAAAADAAAAAAAARSLARSPAGETTDFPVVSVSVSLSLSLSPSLPLRRPHNFGVQLSRDFGAGRFIWSVLCFDEAAVAVTYLLSVPVTD